MVKYLAVLQDFLEAPERAATWARHPRLLGLGSLAFVVSGLSLFLAQSVSRRFMLGLPPSLPLAVVVCLWQLLSGFLLTGILHLVVEMSGGRGDAMGLFVLLGLSELAWALALPAALILRGFMLDSWTLVLLVLMACGWLSMRLKARSLRINYSISPARAWAMLTVPYLALFVSAAVVVTAVFVGAILSLVKLAS